MLVKAEITKGGSNVCIESFGKFFQLVNIVKRSHFMGFVEQNGKEISKTLWL
jgi:hypothetical protein